MRFEKPKSAEETRLQPEDITSVELVSCEGQLGDIVSRGSEKSVVATNKFNIKIHLKDGATVHFQNRKQRQLTSHESYAAGLAIHLENLDLDSDEYQSRRLAIATLYSNEFKSTLEKSLQNFDFVARKYNEYLETNGEKKKVS